MSENEKPNLKAVEDLLAAAAQPHEAGEPEAGSAGGEMLPDLARLQQSLQEAENRCVRVMADFDNFRKRTLANQAEANREEKKRLILDLLEVVDNFQRAMEHAGSEDFVAGIQAIQQQLLSILGRHSLERLEAQDRPFDPNFHEVLDTVAVPDRPDQTITRVYKDGYLFGGRLLRPALVQVAVRPEPPSTEDEKH
jgi:molecular chaperone GrpE